MSKAKTLTGGSFVERLQEASAADLQEVDARIEELERELESLTAARKVLNIRLNGKPERKVKQPRAATNGHADASGARIHPVKLYHLRQKIAKHLDNVGAQKPLTIAQALGVQLDHIKAALDDPEKFEEHTDGSFSPA